MGWKEERRWKKERKNETYDGNMEGIQKEIEIQEHVFFESRKKIELIGKKIEKRFSIFWVPG